MDTKVCYCGCKPELQEAWSLNRRLVGYWVKCQNCGSATDIRGTKKSAINKWNKDDVWMPKSTRLLKKKAQLSTSLHLHYVINCEGDKR